MNVEPSLNGSTAGPNARHPFTRDRLFLTCGLAAALLFWGAAAENADGFYTFLRIYVCGLSLVWAFVFHTLERPAWALATLCLAILFNPIFPVELDRETWQIIDVAACCFYSYLGLQRYALATGRRWVPFLPTAAVAAILVFTNADFRTALGPDASDNNMAIENLEAGNLIVEDDTAGASDPYADLIRNTESSMPDWNALQASQSEATYPEPQSSNVATNSSSTSDPGVSQRWLDNVLGREPNNQGESAANANEQVDSAPEDNSNLNSSNGNYL